VAHPLGQVRGVSPRLILIPALGGNSRQSIGQLAWSVAAWMLTPTRQLATLPRVPRVLAGDPDRGGGILGEAGVIDDPASGSTAAVIWVASRWRTVRQSQRR
jgi:hypothetical protein